MARLARIANIVAVKDATGNLARVTAQRLACGEDFVQLSGNDDMALGFMAMGGIGVHLGQRQCRAAALRRVPGRLPRRRMGEALELQDRLYPLHAALFSDASPGAGQICGQPRAPRFPPDLRLPMTPPSEASRRAVDAALAHAGLA